MCGIVGYTGPKIEIVKKAHALQAHRGPDGSGFYSDASVSLGHNRLAIIDLDERSAQPMWDSSKRYCVVFNGEIFNYQALRESLSSAYSFTTESDTEVLLALYIQHKQNMCAILRGMYAFAIYDTLTGDLFLARDYFGIKPLHYALVNNRLYFASEIRAIVSMFGSENLTLEINQESIRTYLTLGYTIAPNTLYKNIQLLEPGTTLTLNVQNPETITKDKIPFPVTSKATNQESEDLIEEKILASLVADVPVGVFFSGGTDSSLITATLHKARKNLETFSVKVSGRDADEYYFNHIGEKLALKKNVFDFSVTEFDATYKSIADNIDNPAGSSGFYQGYFISKKASEKVKVVLLGDGGDELFLGYDRSFPLYKMKEKKLTSGIWLDRLYFLFPHFYGKNKLFLKLFAWCGSPIGYYLNSVSLLRDHGNFSDWNICRKQIIARVTNSSELDQVLYLQDGLLLRNDAVTSLCSIEGRVPLLDADIAARAPFLAQESYDAKIAKITLKKILSKHLPAELVYRNKSGFGISYRKLLQESKYLREDLKTAINYLEQRNIVIPTEEKIFEKYPHFSLAIINLWHSLKNNERYFSGDYY
jgi:asparagine synthase (glutamine-hydrolysing)